MFKATTAQEPDRFAFKPCAVFFTAPNHLFVLERDCIAVTHPGSKSGGIDLLKDVNGEIVGVQINSFSRIAKWDICDAVIGQFPTWFRFLYRLIKKYRDQQLMREMKAAGFPL